RDQRAKMSNDMPICFTQSPKFMEDLMQNYKGEHLVVKALQSKIIAPKFQREIARRIYSENCSVYKLVEVEGGHHVHIEKPDDVAQVVLDFLVDQKCEGDKVVTSKREADNAVDYGFDPYSLCSA